MRRVNLVDGNVCVLEHVASYPAMPCSSAPIRSVVSQQQRRRLVRRTPRRALVVQVDAPILNVSQSHNSLLFTLKFAQSLFTIVSSVRLTVVLTHSLHKDCLLAASGAHAFEPALLFEAPARTALSSGVCSRRSARYSNVFRLVITFRLYDSSTIRGEVRGRSLVGLTPSHYLGNFAQIMKIVQNLLSGDAIYTRFTHCSHRLFFC